MPKSTVFDRLAIDPRRLREEGTWGINGVWQQVYQFAPSYNICWMAATSDPTPLTDKNREIYGITIIARP